MMAAQKPPRDHRRLKPLAIRTAPCQLCRMVIEVRGRKTRVDDFVLGIEADAFRIIDKSRDLDEGHRPQDLGVAKAHAWLSARASGKEGAPRTCPLSRHYRRVRPRRGLVLRYAASGATTQKAILRLCEAFGG
jgi:hypothetical protein